mmetsp:Transcript_22233/g.54994  ORF Transcript_22233/g.54994 Transcript_22233/m.54994 type:complete len:202 (-) Transcript_22233:532-1137(-)
MGWKPPSDWNSTSSALGKATRASEMSWEMKSFFGGRQAFFLPQTGHSKRRAFRLYSRKLSRSKHWMWEQSTPRAGVLMRPRESGHLRETLRLSMTMPSEHMERRASRFSSSRSSMDSALTAGTGTALRRMRLRMSTMFCWMSPTTVCLDLMRTTWTKSKKRPVSEVPEHFWRRNESWLRVPQRMRLEISVPRSTPATLPLV